jgi:hypothetical protein
MYPLIFHKSLTPAAWSAYPASKQVLMIAIELNRAGNALKNGHAEYARNAYERDFELTDLTVEDVKWRSKLRELLRFREYLGMLYMEPRFTENQQAMNGLLALDSGAWNLLH